MCVALVPFRPSSSAFISEVSETLIPTLLPLTSVYTLQGSSSLLSIVYLCALFTSSVFRRFTSPSSPPTLLFRNVIVSSCIRFHLSITSIFYHFSHLLYHATSFVWLLSKKFPSLGLFKSLPFHNLVSSSLLMYLERLFPVYLS